MLTALLLATTLSVAPPTVPVADGWAQVKAGQSVQEVVREIGRPLLRNAARGYERWVYDDGADVLFCGQSVVSWTCPKRSPVQAGRGMAAATAVPAAPVPSRTLQPAD